MKNTFILASAAAALAITAPAFAGDHSEADYKAKFEAADTNKDGALDKAEWNAKVQSESAKKWTKADANSDGKVTWEEKKAMWDKKHD
jgi:hypothetical protein